MARGNNANSNLYKKLHEEYGLELNVDFYLHPQSGSYIIKHNAVKKIVAKQREKGFIIETPMDEDIKWLNDGTREGIHGKEVVCAGNFYLKAKNGEIIEKVYKLGEVNPKNCKNAYPQTMALKRMYDRGVLDLLRFAQEGLYSDVEADEFKQTKKPPKEITKAPQQAAPPVQAQRPPPVRLAPKISAPTQEPESISKPEPVELNKNGTVDLVISLIENDSINKDGVGITVGQLSNAMHDIGENFDIKNALKTGMEWGLIYKTGERRATRYHLKKDESQTKPLQETNQPSLTKEEFDLLWAKVTHTVRKNNIQYKVLSKSVHAVTKHDTAISAFNSGSLTKEAIEEIERLCILEGSTQERVG